MITVHHVTFIMLLSKTVNMMSNDINYLRIYKRGETKLSFYKLGNFTIKAFHCYKILKTLIL